MPVLLQKHLLPLRLLFPQLLRVLKILLEPLLLGESPPPLDLLAFELARKRRLLVALDSCEFA